MRFRHAIPPGSRSRSWFFASVAGLLAVGVAMPAPVPAQEKKAADKEMKKRVEAAVEKGLEWLKRNQAADGHWDAGAGGGQYRVAMTALAGMCFLMEGSNLKEGKYSDQLKKAVDWFLAVGRQRPNGLIADSGPGGDFGNYMHGHGYATMFLACVYGEAEDKEQQEKLEKAVTKAVEFIAKAQTQFK